MQIVSVRIEKPEEMNFILGQSHFIKTVEDMHEALVNAVPGIHFGLAFCEASGKCLVRWSGTDSALIELATRNAQAIGAGHSFIVFLGAGSFPVNVLSAIKTVPEVVHVFCATANQVEVLVAQTEQGRGILGVVDGSSPKGVEGLKTFSGVRIFCARLATSCDCAYSGAITCKTRSEVCPLDHKTNDLKRRVTALHCMDLRENWRHVVYSGDGSKVIDRDPLGLALGDPLSEPPVTSPVKTYRPTPIVPASTTTVPQSHRFAFRLVSSASSRRAASRTLSPSFHVTADPVV